MDVRVIIGYGDTAFADAAFAMCERTAEPLGLSLSLAHAPDAQAFLEALSEVPAQAFIVTPDAGATISPPEGFSVEVQPENITAAGRASAGADAQIYGLGMAGFGAALDLIAERLA